MTTRVALLEPWFGGSHRQFAEGLARNSQHEVRIFSLTDRHWKWRMAHSAVSLYEQLHDSGFRPEVILANDLVDVAQFRGLMHRDGWSARIITYFHENQFAYPVSPRDEDSQQGRDHHYRLQNYTSALASDLILFNSAFNRESFLNALPDFLALFPDGQSEERIESIRAKSRVLPLGLDLASLDQYRSPSSPERPVILWNHRWSYDKNPESFFNTMIQLREEGLEFSLVVLGKGSERSPQIFPTAREVLHDRILHWGWVNSRAEYASWLWRSTLLPVTSLQDFFGISVVEAIYCGCQPVLPDRLAFPEHIQDAGCFFDSEAEFLNLTREAVERNAKPKPEWRSDVGHYDWSISIARYNEILESANTLSP